MTSPEDQNKIDSEKLLREVEAHANAEKLEKEIVYDVPLMQASVGDIVMGEPGWGGPLKITSKDVLDPKNPHFYLGTDDNPRRFEVDKKSMDKYRAARKEPSAEPEIVVTEKEIQDCYNDALSVFGDTPFSIGQFAHNMGLDWEMAVESDKSLVTKIFDTLVERGKFEKFKRGEDKFVVVREAQQSEPQTGSAEKKEIGEVFKTPETILAYLKSLLDNSESRVGRPGIRPLKFDIEDDTSVEEVKGKIEKAHQKGYLSKEEMEHALALLGGEKVETQTKDPALNLVVDFTPPTQPKPKVVPVTEAPVVPVTPAPEAEVIPAPIATEVPPTQPLAPEAPASQPPIPEPLKPIENTNLILQKALDNYSSLLADHKNKNREKKKWFAHKISEIGANLSDVKHNVLTTGKNVLSDFGFAKQMPESQKSPEVKTAEREYTEAKKKKMLEIFAIPVTQLEIEALGLDPNLSDEDKKQAVMRERALAQVEQEFDKLQNKILALTPKSEKGIARKIIEVSLKIWKKIPIAGRLALFPVLIGVGAAFAAPAGVGLAAGASVAGLRLARGIGGFAGAKVTGMGADWAFGKKNTHTRNEAEKVFANGEISETNIIEKGKEFETYLAKEKNAKKRQMAYKAGAMIVGGIGIGLGVGKGATLAENALSPHSGAGSFLPNSNKPIVDSGVKPRSEFLATKEQNAVLAKELEGFKPEKNLGNYKDLSSFDEKPPAGPVVQPTPPGGTHPAVGPEIPKVAETYDFDKDIYGRDVPVAPKPASSSIPLSEQTEVPEHNAEMPDVDDSQIPENVSTPHLEPVPEPVVSGNPAYMPDSIKNVTAEPISNPEDIPHPNLETIPHAPTSELPDLTGASPKQTLEALNHYNETHFKAPSPPELPDSGAVVPHADVPEMRAPEPIFPPHEVATPETDITTSGGVTHILKHFEQNYQGKNFKVDIADVAGKKCVLFEGVKVAETVSAPDGKGTVLQLLDQYQDGYKYEVIRKLFTQARVGTNIFENIKTPKGATVFGVGFEDGRIDVLHGMGDNKNAVGVFLNGKEIAKGLVTDKGPAVEIFDKLKHDSWFGMIEEPDTVYERAFDRVESLIKTFKVVNK